MLRFGQVVPGKGLGHSHGRSLDRARRASSRARLGLDGNYSAVRELLWSRADTVIWLDLPLWLVEWRLVRRSLWRWLAREELWNGNREPGPLGWTDPEHPIRWAWKKHAEYRTRYAARFADPAFAHIERIRLHTRGEVRDFLGSVSRIGTPPAASRACE